MRKNLKLAAGGILLLLSTAAAAAPKQHAVDSGSTSLTYRIMWLDSLFGKTSFLFCWSDDCA